MVFNILTLIICCCVIILSALTSLCNTFFRFRKYKSENNEKNDEETVPNKKFERLVSILLYVRNGESEYLDKNLQTLLEQDYPENYQAVVVIEKGDTRSEDILKRYVDDSRLHLTYIPNTSRYMSREKLAITIGVKAAKSEWIILLKTTCTPASHKWLTTMATNFSDDKNLVIGYTKYKNAKSYRNFYHLHTFCYIARAARYGTAYCTNSANLAFRKSDFMRGNGFQGNLHLVRGEYDFIVNKYAEPTHTALELSPESWLYENEQNPKAWKQADIFYQETRKHLKRSFMHRALYNFDTLAMYINYIVIAIALSYSIPLHNWTITIAASLALITTIVLRTLFAKKIINRFDESISAWTIIPHELAIFSHNAANILRHRLANENDFTSHKI